MLEIRNLSIFYNDRYLIKDLSFNLNSGDKLAIIGEEGNGKSTLLKAIFGNLSYGSVTGSINLKGHRIGYLEQSMNYENLRKTVYDFLFIDDCDYYSKVNDLYKYLALINLSDDVIEREIITLSGGEKVKVGILKLLLDDADILLLDEPTNDLDISTLEWLEDFINNTSKVVIYVSHDEVLLANTANMILHIEQLKNKTVCRHTLLAIDYETYVSMRLRAIDKQIQVSQAEKRQFKKKQDKLKQIMQKVEYQQNTISRSDPHGAKLLKKKMHALKSQEKRLDDTCLTEVPDVEENINFSFESNVMVTKMKKIVTMDIPELLVGDKLLARNIKLEIIGNVHMCIIGNNGVGKSTLLKMINEKIRNRDDIKIGYMPQNYDDVLNAYDDVFSFLCSNGDKDTITNIRKYLGNMKFTKEEMTGKISSLSNGTKAKLFLLKFVLDGCNVLLLDEPTRNVSPLSNPVIRKVLKEYKGTIISVSHDRKYIEQVVDSLYVLNFDGLKQIC